jgi:hypothetical protein
VFRRVDTAGSLRNGGGGGGGGGGAAEAEDSEEEEEDDEVLGGRAGGRAVGVTSGVGRGCARALARPRPRACDRSAPRPHPPHTLGGKPARARRRAQGVAEERPLMEGMTDRAAKALLALARDGAPPRPRAASRVAASLSPSIPPGPHPP